MTATLRTLAQHLHLLPLLLLLACQTLQPEPRVVIEQESDGWWSVTWQLDRPVTELEFEREANGIRGEVFEVSTPGWRVTGPSRMAGPPAREIEVRIRQFARQLEKEYDFFEVFSDGSAALYTGHYLTGTVRAYRFVPGPGQSIVIAGQRHSGPVSWRDEHGQGTFAYFGTIEPVVTDDIISIIDPALPDWLETRTRTLLPQLFSLYAERLGRALSERPTVLFSYTDSEASGYNSGGGTLPGLIQLSVEGRAWEKEEREGMLHFFHFLAHEAAHLWNGQLIHYPGSDEAWMHEGSADALAQRALLAHGLIDEERFLEYQTAALNECLRNPRDVYNCGNMLALLTETSGVDLFTFWRRLIEHVLGGDDNLYTSDDYVDVLASFGIEDVRTDDIAAALREKGVRLVEADPPQSYGQRLARDALVHLMSSRCHGRFGFRSTLRGLLLDPDLDCPGLDGGSVVRTIGGHDVLREGHRVWDHVQRQCEVGGAVLVEGSKWSCAKPIPPRPPYFRIVARGGPVPPADPTVPSMRIAP